MIDVSIITVSYKGWERLRRSLESLSSFSNTEFNAEIIVVDNNSCDSTLDDFERIFTGVRFIRNEVNGGFANGCNKGASFASGEFLLFLNPDTVASEDALSAMVGTARRNPQISVLSCRQVNERGRECVVSGPFPAFHNLTGFLRMFGPPASPGPAPSDPGPRLSYPDWVSGSVLMVRKDIFTSLGGFDEDYWMYYEDVDICWRATLSGGLVALLHDAVIEHNHGGSSRINPRTAAITKTEVHISKHVYISKHEEGLSKILIQSFLVINNILTNLITAIAGILMFFIPGIRLRVLVFRGLLLYYAGVLRRKTWVSPLSVGRKDLQASHSL